MPLEGPFYIGNEASSNHAISLLAGQASYGAPCEISAFNFVWLFLLQK